MANVHDVSAYLLARSDKPLSPWQLHKLLYYCQGWHLAWELQPLFPERIDAWANGPVVPALYPFHRGSFDLLKRWPQGRRSALSKNERESVDQVLSYYGKFNPQELTELVKSEGLWLRARGGLSFGERGRQQIAQEALKSHFGEREERTRDGFTIARQNDLDWLPQPNRAAWVVGGDIPQAKLTTTAFVLAFKQNQLLMAKIGHSNRGWNPLGGHIEPGETAIQAAAREVWEEGRARLRALRYFGYQHLQAGGRRPKGYLYPHSESYQLFFIGEIDRLERFKPTDEVLARELFSPERARRVRWIREHRDFYERALVLSRDL